MPPEDRDPRNSIFTDRRQIAALLGRVLRARSLISVSLDHGDPHSSLLLEVAPLRGCLLLDVPVPALLEVRSCEPQGSQTRLGLRLVDLTPAQDTLLSAEINALQRRSLRGRG